MEAKENKKIKKSVRIRLEKEAQKEAIKSISGRQGAVAASYAISHLLHVK